MNKSCQPKVDSDIFSIFVEWLNTYQERATWHQREYDKGLCIFSQVYSLGVMPVLASFNNWLMMNLYSNAFRAPMFTSEQVEYRCFLCGFSSKISALLANMKASFIRNGTIRMKDD